LADEWDEVVEELDRQLTLPPGKRPAEAGEFVVMGRPAGARLSPAEEEILRGLAERPLALAALAGQRRAGALARRQIAALEARGLVRRAAFTPTDALHVLGRHTPWCVEAARLGAGLLAQQLGIPVAEFCARVVSGVAQRAAVEVVRKALADELGRAAWHEETAAATFLRLALDGDLQAADDNEIGCAITLRRPLVAIGAPVAAYMPEAAHRLHTELVIPPHAEVANAVGAVSGSVVMRQRVLINPLPEEEVLRVHLPDAPCDFARLEEAVAYAREVVSERLAEQARAAGAEQVEVQMTRHDRWAPTRGGGLDAVYLGTELAFAAVGRPRPAR